MQAKLTPSRHGWCDHPGGVQGAEIAISPDIQLIHRTGFQNETTPRDPRERPSATISVNVIRILTLRARELVRLPVFALGLLAVTAGGLSAQEEPTTCDTGRISNVFIDNHSVFDLSDPRLNPGFDWAYKVANRFHSATRESVIRRELLFDTGDCYDVELLRDSERLLRSLQFIAAVDIYGVRQADGSIHVIVDTRDEWSLRVEPQIGGGQQSGLTGVHIREDNLSGRGTHLSGYYLNDYEAQVYGASFHTPQLFGSRWDATLEAGRTPVGGLLNQAIAHPFVGEVGRWGFRQSTQLHDRYFEYVMRDGTGELQRLWFPERRIAADVGLAFRLGHDGFNRTVLGAAVAGEWVTYPDDHLPRFADPALADSVPQFDGLRRDTLRSVRAIFMVGQRNIHYRRARRLDTVNGTEDVRLGVESEIALGPSIPGLTHRQDLAVDIVVSAASELWRSSIIGGQFVLEARRDYRAAPDEPEWTDVFGQLNLWGYLRDDAESPSVLVAALNAAGGWHDAVPFQLTLGRDAGLRGFPSHVHPGARRVVGTLEYRRYLQWPFPDLFDTGAVAFVDAGRIWAGSAPFGETSGVRANAGVGLRFAFPPGSRQTLRVDVGVPLGSAGGIGNAVFSAGIGQLVGVRTVVSDPQLTRSTRATVSPSIFILPTRRR